MTARIRWEPNGYGGHLGYVGSIEDWLFQVWRPGIDEWQLDSTLPGRFGQHPRSGNPDQLKAGAERWLEEFVRSLGAVFPEKRTCPACYGSGTDSTVNRNDCERCNGNGSILAVAKGG